MEVSSQNGNTALESQHWETILVRYFKFISEADFERWITANPKHREQRLDILLEQSYIGSGKPDLIGIDAKGDLVVIELKCNHPCYNH